MSKTNQDQISFSGFGDNLRFHYWRGKGHLFRYFLNRLRWHYYPDLKCVTPYPEHVDLEISSSCNMKCPMCYTRTDEFKKRVKRAFMEEHIWRKVIRECAKGGVFSLRLSWRGEPTIHPDFVRAARYAKELGIKEVSTLTNALALTPEIFKELVEIGFDWISISADGLGHVYEDIRRPAKFNELIAKLERFKEIKKNKNSVKPVLKVQTVWPAIHDDPGEYYKVFAPLVDQVSCNQLVDYLFLDEAEGKIAYNRGFSCHVPYQRLTIASDGSVPLCYNDEMGHDLLGHISDMSIKEIWHGKKMTELRRRYSDGTWAEAYTACRRCFLPREMQELPTVKVGGRNVRVNALKNRIQKIGR